LCFEANLKKLKAIALFRLNQKESFEEIYKLLNKSYEIFEKYSIPHGVAVVSFIKSFFLFSKQSEFYFIYRDNKKTLEEALDASNKSFQFYEKIGHKFGQA